MFINTGDPFSVDRGTQSLNVNIQKGRKVLKAAIGLFGLHPISEMHEIGLNDLNASLGMQEHPNKVVHG